ncbi:HEXXH motif domain-containing protein [Lentzea californiensis]|uniref:HEXXH motif domain-containing protein n=1 Tax=Lentzea californiensis TaxID=438851 RepID=UPI0021650BD1|nr:HEXXH motif domain-containing protein [Lentzea californiensis]MCR3754173.1 HEXXH motif-containing protein [Lentzea californiensis]
MTDLAPLSWVRTPSLVFWQTCDGPVSSLEATALRHGQHSHRKLLLRTFAEAVGAVGDELGPFRTDRAWELLDAAEQESPEAVAEVVMYPSVGIWLSRVLRQVLGRRLDDTPLWSEVGGFHALAAAVAVRSGLEFEIDVPVVHGVVWLPSVGVLRTDRPTGHAVLRGGSGGFELTIDGEVQRPRLEAVRHHVAKAGGRALRIVLDDVDPYREFSAPLPPRPLAEQERAEWFRQMDGAWELLMARHPGFADELSACLASIVPLAGRDMFAVSSSAAFGSVAMSPKASAVEFAEALTHEIQHSKVNALLDLAVLCRDGDDCRFHVPWLDHPRGVTGLLHGVYAFCSVVEYWFVERNFVAPELARRARFNFSYRRHQVAEVLSYLGDLPELTDLGREFVMGVSARLDACPATDLPGDLAQDVEWVNTDHHVLWRLRHVQPDKQVAEALAEAWLAGEACDQDFGPDVVAVSPESGRSPLGTLLKARALEGRASAGTDAEGAFLHGDLDHAAKLFAARLEASPKDLTAWSGLALASGSATLLRRPEVVHAVYHALALRGGTKPDPFALTAWFDQTAS